MSWSACPYKRNSVVHETSNYFDHKVCRISFGIRIGIFLIVPPNKFWLVGFGLLMSLNGFAIQFSSFAAVAAVPQYHIQAFLVSFLYLMTIK